MKKFVMSILIVMFSGCANEVIPVSPVEPVPVVVYPEQPPVIVVEPRAPRPPHWHHIVREPEHRHDFR